MISCQKTIIDSKKNKSTIIKQQVTNSDSIVTNSLKPNFIYDLIETKKVPVGDTILFRNWSASRSRPVGIYDNKIKYILSTDSVSKFYKTGEIKFSKDKITVLNTFSKKYFNIKFIAILDYSDDAYDMNQPSSYPKISKLSKTVGQFDFSGPIYKEYSMDFKIKNNAIHIIKLSNLSYSYSETYKYELDTLIVLGNNSVIYPDSLRAKVCKEKNRIPVKDSRK